MKVIIFLLEGLFPQVTQCVDEFQIGGRRWFVETTITTNLDPTSILAIEGFRCRKYLLIGAQSKFK